MKLPGRKLSGSVGAGFHLDDTGRSKIRPRKLFLSGPHNLYRALRLAREACRFQGRVAGMLAAVSRSRIGHNDAYIFLRYPERTGNPVLNAERTLCSRPDRYLVALPPGDRRSRLQRRVSNVIDIKSLVGRCLCPCQTASNITAAIIAARGFGMLYQVVEYQVARRLRFFLPLSPHQGQRALGGKWVRSTHADELCIVHCHDTG